VNEYNTTRSSLHQVRFGLGYAHNIIFLKAKMAKIPAPVLRPDISYFIIHFYIYNVYSVYFQLWAP